jgi:hypothetical protein
MDWEDRIRRIQINETSSFFLKKKENLDKNVQFCAFKP